MRDCREQERRERDPIESGDPESPRATFVGVLRPSSGPRKKETKLSTDQNIDKRRAKEATKLLIEQKLRGLLLIDGERKKE